MPVHLGREALRALRRLIQISRLTFSLILLAFLAAPLAGAADWPMYLGDLTHSGFAASESVINAQTASSLALRWSIPAPAVTSVQPTVAGNRVYWGTWDGNMHAATTDGSPIWTTNLGTTPGGCGGTYGVVSSATVATIARGETVFVGGGDGQFYALDAATGAVVWKTRLGPSPATMVWSSPVLYNGSIYVGSSSTDDCPLIQGKLYRLDATTGTTQNTFDIVPDGCLGGGLWGTPTVDPATGNLYFATGNPSSCPPPPEPYAVAVVAVRLSDLTYVDSWRVPDSQYVSDGDFGSTPTFFQATINGMSRQLLGIANKNGIYYVLDRNALSAGPVWERQVAVGGDPVDGYGSISPSEWDGKTLYVAGGATTIEGTSCAGSLRALDPATGQPLWEDCLDGIPLGAVTGAPGIVTVAAGSKIHVVSAATGASLFEFSEPSRKPFYGGGSIADGVLYYGNTDGTLLAFAPPAASGTMTFTVGAGGDDGDVTARSATYPPSATPIPYSGGTVFTAGRRYAFGSYQVLDGLVRFDTSALPDNATITSATLRLYVTAKADGDNRNLVGDWYSAANWPIDASDYNLDPTGSAFTADITAINTAATNDFALTGLGSISKTGYTGLRLQVDGGHPTADNYIQLASYENGLPKPQLIVTYTTS